jgi:hypothetical protein
VTSFFSWKLPMTQTLRVISTGAKVAQKDVKCAENVDLGGLVLESWSHNSKARAGSPR